MMESRGRAQDGIEVLERTLRQFSVRGGSRYSLVRRDGRVLLALPECGATSEKLLGLYQPQRTKGVVAARLLGALVRTGLHRHVLQSWNCPGFGGQAAPGILIGSAGHLCDRAIAVFEGPHGWEVTKLGFGSRAGEILGAEARVLERLQATPVQVPVIRSFDHEGDTALLSTDWQAGVAWRSGDFGPLLALLKKFERDAGSRCLDQFEEWAFISQGLSVTAEGRARAKELATLPFRTSIRHGDLTRPNLRMGKDGALRVHDWERGSLEGVPGLDLVHFLTQDLVFRSGLKPKEVVQTVRARLAGPDLVDLLRSCGWANRLSELMVVAYALNTGAGYLPQEELLNAALKQDS